MYDSVKEQWLTALRSGNYEQGRGLLRRDDKFCCLGVLCDLAVKNKVIPEAIRKDDGVYAYGEDLDYSLLPDEVMDWAGLADHNPGFSIAPSGDTFSLSGLNDDGETLSQIADLIEMYF